MLTRLNHNKLMHMQAHIPLLSSTIVRRWQSILPAQKTITCAKAIRLQEATYMVVRKINLIDLREAGSEELRNGPSHVAAIQVQLLQPFEGTCLLRNWTLNIEVCHM